MEEILHSYIPIIENKKGEILNEIVSGEDLVLNLKYKTNGFVDKLAFLLDIRIKDVSGIELVALSTDEMGVKFNDFKEEGYIQIIFDEFIFRGGKYFFDIHSSLKINKRVALDNLMNAFAIEVIPGDYYNTGTSNNINSVFLMKSEIKNI